jgi:hypothetical protein
LFPREKKDLSCSPRQLKLLLPKDMIVPWEKKDLSCSPRQLKLLLPKDMIVPRGEKAISPRNNKFSPRKGPSSLGKYMKHMF